MRAVLALSGVIFATAALGQGVTLTGPSGGMGVVATTFANLPASPAAGQIAYISNGLAADCGDTTCTTWGTAVTGGGGSLKLLIWYDGANWTLIGK